MRCEARNVMYLRLSVEDEEEKYESCSISSQRACIERYLQERPALGKDFEEIVDDGYSGTDFDRPGMRRLLSLIERGEIRTIIVRDLSRFARNYLEAGYYLEVVFPSMGIHFISINDGFDSEELGEDTGGLSLAIRNLVNQMYSRDISRKIKSVVDMKKHNGEYAFGAVPYGYKKGEKHNTIVLDEPAAKVVRRIFDLAADGQTITQIALALNEEGVTTPSVYLSSVRGKYRARGFWTYESVRNILQNRIYTGDTEVFKSHVACVGSKRVKLIPEELRQVIPETHEAIVSRTTYYLARRTVKCTASKKPSREQSSPLSSHVVCGCCGNRMSKGKQRNKTWLCASARYTHDTGCKAVRMDDRKLQDILLRAIQTQCELLDARVKQLNTARQRGEERSSFFQRELSACKRIVSQARDEKMLLYEKYVEGRISKDTFIKLKGDAAAREEDAALQVSLLQKRLGELSAEAGETRAELCSIEERTKYRGISELTPELVRELVKEVVVYPEDRLRIEWSFRDDILPQNGAASDFFTESA